MMASKAIVLRGMWVRIPLRALSPHPRLTGSPRPVATLTRVSEVVLGVLLMTGVLLVLVVAPWRGRKDALPEADVYTALSGEDPDEP